MTLRIGEDGQAEVLRVGDTYTVQLTMVSANSTLNGMTLPVELRVVGIE